jgi:S-formylglutathione hydrolase
MPSTITLHDISSQHLPAPVPYAVLRPGSEEPLPLCILLLGAGGTRDSLFDLQELFDSCWVEGSVPPMIIVTPTPGLDYYLEDCSGPIRWDSFLAADFVPHLRSAYNSSDAVIAGISGGGYGALKLAFARPRLFAGVAAMQPMLEPGLHEFNVGPRNRIHHSSGGPPQLVGPGRDPLLWESNNPANLARANAQEIRDAGLAIYIDAADRDFLNAHDGAEFLHRVLWDLDLSHGYHLVRDADHGGPTMRPRLRDVCMVRNALEFDTAGCCCRTVRHRLAAIRYEGQAPRGCNHHQRIPPFPSDPLRTHPRISRERRPHYKSPIWFVWRLTSY